MNNFLKTFFIFVTCATITTASWGAAGKEAEREKFERQLVTLETAFGELFKGPVEESAQKLQAGFMLEEIEALKSFTNLSKFPDLLQRLKDLMSNLYSFERKAGLITQDELDGIYDKVPALNALRKATKETITENPEIIIKALQDLQTFMITAANLGTFPVLESMCTQALQNISQLTQEQAPDRHDVQIAIALFLAENIHFCLTAKPHLIETIAEIEKSQKHATLKLNTITIQENPKIIIESLKEFCRFLQLVTNIEDLNLLCEKACKNAFEQKMGECRWLGFDTVLPTIKNSEIKQFIIIAYKLMDQLVEKHQKYLEKYFSERR